MPGIRELTAADAARVADAVRRGGWGDRTALLSFAARCPACTPYLLEEGGAVVATGMGLANGVVGWIGLIWTAPACRGRGIGRAMTERVAAGLTARGCTTLLLDASELGRPVYAGLGFAPVGRDRSFVAPGGVAPVGPMPDSDDLAAVEPRVRPLEPGDLGAVVVLDGAATGEDRRFLIEAAAGQGLVVDGIDDRLRGYLATPAFGRTAVIASDEAAALALLRARQASGPLGEHVRIALPEANERGVAALRAGGWSEEPGTLRMVRGPLPAWDPELIWGIYGYATG